MGDTSLEFLSGVAGPTAKSVLAHNQNGIFSTINITPNTLTMTSEETKIEMPDFSAVSYLFSVTQDCVLFLFESESQKRHRIRINENL